MRSNVVNYNILETKKVVIPKELNKISSCLIVVPFIELKKNILRNP